MTPIYSITEAATKFSCFGAMVIALLLWRRSDETLRLTTFLLVFTQLINITMILVRSIWVNNMPVLHIYTAGSYIIIALIYASWHEGRLAKWLLWSIIVYLGIHATLLITGIEQLGQADKYSEQVVAFFITAITLWTIVSLAVYQPDLLTHKQPLFWITMGIFMLFPGTIFVSGAVVDFYTSELLVIYYFMATFGYGLIAVGYLFLLGKDRSIAQADESMADSVESELWEDYETGPPEAE